ncbi:hypothetical protein EYF80_062316 [Liparis tanakae]|uniref:Uncharacterized protein n=1 Tax=Liparis tanakae TaxID=230148 RepID=A0A4Z2EG80_9TELE|nr:hypothetical protein EYF80_062316 [Liparis tanakae]
MQRGRHTGGAPGRGRGRGRGRGPLDAWSRSRELFMSPESHVKVLLLRFKTRASDHEGAGESR